MSPVVRTTIIASSLFFLILLSPLASAASQQVKELDSVIAVVNDDVITASELKKRIRQILAQLKNKKKRLPAKNILYRQILEQLITEKIQLQLAKRASVITSDESVNKVIQKIAKENKLTLTQFKEILQRDGVRYDEFRDNIKNEMTISQLKKRRISNQISVTEQEVDIELQNQNNNKALSEEFRLSQILIATPESASPAQIQEAKVKANQILAQLSIGADFAETAAANSNGQNALNGGDLGWREAAQLPSVFVEQVIKLQANQITGLIRSPSGFHIVKVVERRSKDKRRIVEQTHAKHILIIPNQINNSAVVKEKLSRLRERIISGEDFAPIAKANSEDKASAAKGGDLGWVNPGVTVPEFQEEMAKLAPGEVSKPIRSRYGWHIIKVIARRQHDDTNTYLRDKIRKQIGQRKTEEAVSNWLRRLRNEAYVEYRINK